MPALYFTPQQVAERFNCSARHVRRLAESGKLAGLRVGDLWRFSPAAVEAYEQAQTVSPTDLVVASGARQITERPAASMEGFALPDGFEPTFPELWNLPIPTKKASSQRH